MAASDPTALNFQHRLASALNDFCGARRGVW
jgi:hypothetical protein